MPDMDGIGMGELKSHITGGSIIPYAIQNNQVTRGLFYCSNGCPVAF